MNEAVNSIGEIFKANSMILYCIVIFVVAFAFGFIMIMGTANLNKEEGRKKGFKRGKLIGSDKYYDEKIGDKIETESLEENPYLKDDMEHHSSKRFKSQSVSD